MLLRLRLLLLLNPKPCTTQLVQPDPGPRNHTFVPGIFPCNHFPCTQIQVPCASGLRHNLKYKDQRSAQLGV